MQSGETAGLGIFYPKGYNNMWHVILQILAVIGIVLLVLLALLILTVLAVLFVPIRYRARGCGGGQLSVSAPFFQMAACGQ